MKVDARRFTAKMGVRQKRKTRGLGFWFYREVETEGSFPENMFNTRPISNPVDPKTSYQPAKPA